MIVDKKQSQRKPKTGTKIVTGRVVGANQTVVDPNEVYKLSMIGCTDSEIADWFVINVQCLRENFEPELSKGRAGLKQKIRMYQIQMAEKSAPMLIWLGKQYLGQSENPINTEANQPLPWTHDDLINELDKSGYNK